MMTHHKNRLGETGNTKIFILVAIVLVAVAGLAYYTMHHKAGQPQADGAVSADTAVQNEAEAAFVIKPGNPVVARIDGQDIKRLDVFNFIQTLPAETRQIPTEQLFPAALEQVINARVIGEKTKKANLDSDPEVKRQLEEARQNIVRNVYVQKQVEERLTDARLTAAYEQYKANFPAIEEVRARHILVDEESVARDLITQIKDGADFAALAKANSKDGTAENGGEVGYFSQEEVVPEFSEAAFALDAGAYTKEPVKTQFGFHVIKVEEKRRRPPADFEQVKPFLEAQLRRLILDEVVQGWRADANIERFDINGEASEAASSAPGEERG